jgi:hypothetical protein
LLVLADAKLQTFNCKVMTISLIVGWHNIAVTKVASNIIKREKERKREREKERQEQRKTKTELKDISSYVMGRGCSFKNCSLKFSTKTGN